MNKQLKNARTPDPAHFATGAMMLEDPLDYLAEDHFRAKTMCEIMRRVADNEVLTATERVEIVNFLRHELPLLLHDEDDGLCELLRNRTLPESDFDRLLVRITASHKSIEEKRVEAMAAFLRLEARGSALTNDERLLISDLERLLREDMILENAKLLTLARMRLTAGDIAQLRGRMLQRHMADFDRI